MIDLNFVKIVNMKSFFLNNDKTKQKTYIIT